MRSVFIAGLDLLGGPIAGQGQGCDHEGTRRRENRFGITTDPLTLDNDFWKFPVQQVLSGGMRQYDLLCND